MKNTAAKLKNGVVEQVIVGTVQWAQENLGAEWIDSTDHSVGIGFTFNGSKFIPPKPFESWVYVEDGNYWKSPVPYPEDETKEYEWNEDLMAWTDIDQNTAPSA
jgi:hypothetical protein